MSRQNNSNQVATIQPPRMKMPENVAEEYSLNEDSWRALVDAVFPSAKTVGAVTMALAYCKKNSLDIFQRPVHIVPMYVNGRSIESVWPGIAQLRIVAQRQESFAGYDDCEFGPMVENHDFKGKAHGQNNSTYDVSARVSFPEWAQFTVYKMMHGQRIPLKGPKVYWLEAFSNRASAGGQCPNAMWEQRPIGQLEKCAEAAALRRAFPDVLGNEYAMEEMEGRNLGEGAIEGSYVEVEAAGAGEKKAKPKPRQQDYKPAAQTGTGERGVQQQQRQAKQEPAREQEADFEEVEEPQEQENSEPPGWSKETALLESDGIPAAGEWNGYLEILRKRLERITTEQHINELQDAQQFRIDAAPPGVQSEALELFADAIASLEPVAEGDNGEK